MLYRSAVAAVVLSALSMTVVDTRAHDETKYPDWSGQWQRAPDGGPPRYDPSKPLRKQEAPLKPEYRAKYEASIKDQDDGGQGLDTAYACMPHGMPRQMAGVFPMEFLFSPEVTYILFELMTLSPRRIYTDGRPWPAIREPTFVGTSIGKWLDTDGDGRYDTLEIETRNVRNPRTWDQSGMPLADDNDGIIKERLYLNKNNPDILHSEMTTIDNSLTQPWSVLKNYRRIKNVQWNENNCTEANPHVTIAKEVYFISAEGHLMPSKKHQPAPDLRYFTQPRK